VLVEVAAKEGASVERGQLLARIDDAQAQARFESARARFDQVKLLMVRLEAAKLEAEYAEKDCARLTELGKKVVSESELASARLTARRASFRVKEAEEELETTNQVGEADIRAAKAELDRTRITAPIDGIVVERYVDQGEWVKLGDPICRVIRMDRLRLEGLVPAEECDPGDLTPGQDVQIAVKLPHGGREDATLPGKITFVSPLMLRGTRYEVWAEFENPKRKGQWVVRPGLKASMIVKDGVSGERYPPASEDVDEASPRR
jgi:RND family efflux transporter MFP subunit